MKNLMMICMLAVFMLAVSGTARADMVAHWMFDETSGLTASDSSGNSNDGTLTNMAGDEWLDGALHFDGDNDHVKVLSPPFPAIDSQITIAMWVNADIVEDGKILLWKSGNYGLAVGYSAVSGAPGTFGFTIKGDVWKTVSSTTTPVAGEWYHIAGTFDGTAISIYLNGVLESTLPYSGSFNSDPWLGYEDVCVGGHPWTGEDLTFEGLIDDARVYNHALSADEIAALANPECVPAPSGMVGWWPGDGSADDIVSGNDGTLVGDAIFVSPGKVGDAFTFSGTGEDYVLIPNDASLEPETVTVDAWVRASSPGSVGYIVAKGVDTCSAASYALYTGGTGGLYFYIFNGSSYVPSPDAGTGVWDNQWHHVAGTYDGSSVRLYVDGTEVDSGTATSISIGYGLPTHNDLVIGQCLATCYSGAPFQGDIDEVEIFNRALSADEIQDIYNAGSAGKCIDVDIDIKPGSNEDSSNENTIPLDSLGLIPVAIFSVCGDDGIPIFDATTIDPATLELAGASVDVRMQGKGSTFMAQKCDVNGDGCIDLIVHIATANLDEGALQDGLAILTGETTDGKTIVGLDYITIVPVE